MNVSGSWWKTAAVFGFLAIAGLALAACGNDDAEDGDEVNEVTVVASDLLAFEPSEVRVSAGERVRLVLDNSDSHDLHDLVIHHIPVEDVHEEGAEDAGHDDHADHDLHVAAHGGETGTVEFTPTEPGEYEFICTEPGHEASGMTGVLIVE